MFLLLNRTSLWLVAHWSLLCAWPAFAVESQAPTVHAHITLPTIRVDEIRQHVEVLADDSLEGREAGKAGGRAAATYLMRAYKEVELRPAGDGGTFFQSFRADFRNVLALREGDDPDLRDQVVILCAHFDHVGYGSRTSSKGTVGYIHNGADDNASGTAAVVEIAKSLARWEGRLNRTVLFAFWDAEEKGLLGSKHWMKHPTIPLEHVSMVINLDMIGRLRDKLSLFGTRSYPGMRLEWSRANKGNVPLDFPWHVMDNSDHFPFFQRRIPITMLHTGLHEDYHTSRDDVHLLDYSGIADTAELVQRFLIDVANQPELPRFRRESLRETRRRQREFERPFVQPQRKLGVNLMPVAEGLEIRSVADRSMATQHDLRVGQRLVKMDGQPLTSVGQLRDRLAHVEDSVQLTVNDGVENREVHIVLPNIPRPRIGIAWRETDAEPNTIVVSGVYDGSAAASSGLRRFDRIHQVDGKSFASGQEFQQLSAEAQDSVRFLIERDGSLRELHVNLPDGTRGEPVAEATTEVPVSSAPAP